MKVILAIGLCCAQVACATSIQTPVADGSVYSSGGVISSGPIFIGGGTVEGDLQFASFYSAGYDSIQLELNPYELPLLGNDISVYGYDNAAGSLSGSDYGAGTYLGTLILPAGLVNGQEVFFDVTAFVQAATGSDFGFELQSSGSGIFSSTTYNYGTPPELVASNVPDSLSTGLGLLTGLIGVIALRRKLRLVGN